MIQKDLGPNLFSVTTEIRVMLTNKMNEYSFSENIPGVGCLLCNQSWASTHMAFHGDCPLSHMGTGRNGCLDRCS